MVCNIRRNAAEPQGVGLLLTTVVATEKSAYANFRFDRYRDLCVKSPNA